MIDKSFKRKNKKGAGRPRGEETVVVSHRIKKTLVEPFKTVVRTFLDNHK